MNELSCMKRILAVFIFPICFSVQAQTNHSVWLDDLPIPSYSEGIPSVTLKNSAANAPIQLGKHSYIRGLGVHATSVLFFMLDGKGVSFSATVGADDLANPEMVTQFYVIGDRKILFESGDMKTGDNPKQVKVDLHGVQRLGLLVTNRAEMTKTYSDWADARFEMLDNYQPGTVPNNGEKYILTPKTAASPAIHSPGIFGARPGNPFLYTITATGAEPMRYTADHLPEGLHLDGHTGIISGTVKERGDYRVTMHAANHVGQTAKTLLIKIGDTICLTPPMGWNGWNSWAREIDRDKVMLSARAMVKSGLRNHGWTYINIDDAWQGQRGGKWKALQPNEKFPQFGEMIDSIHAMGLKLGVYSTPWISSYAGYPGGSSDFSDGSYPDSVRNNKRAYRYIGKYRFEEADARQMADWGVDFLKYDWRIELPSAERMQKALVNSGRDIVYSLSNAAPFTFAKDWARVSNMFRTGPDIRDSWTSLYLSVFTLDKWMPYGGPGHWPDPDMMILGNVTTGAGMHPTRLTPDEQYSHMSLFCLLSAPLLLGCPLEKLDAFTLNLLTNDEVLAIDQDIAGQPARLVKKENGFQYWLKHLADGSYALGIFNTDGFGETPQSYFRWGDEKARTTIIDLSSIGLQGNYQVRDLWRQHDLGSPTDKVSTTVPHHGVVLVRLTKN